MAGPALPDPWRRPHQLEHDFLAARHRAADSGRWTPPLFDGLTFRAATFDVIALALEQLDREGDRDAFLRKVYDWNWRGTVTAMATAEQDGSAAASTLVAFSRARLAAASTSSAQTS